MPARRRWRCTAARRRNRTRGFSDWDFIARVATGVSIPVFGSGDCIEPEQLVERLSRGGVSGVLVGRGALRNPWIFRQAADLAAGRAPRAVTDADRAQFLLAYIEMLQQERLHEDEGFPPRRAWSGRARRVCRAGARSRPVGDQQAARAELVVHEGARQRLAPAGRRSTRPTSIAQLREIIRSSSGPASARTLWRIRRHRGVKREHWSPCPTPPSRSRTRAPRPPTA